MPLTAHGKLRLAQLLKEREELLTRQAEITAELAWIDAGIEMFSRSPSDSATPGGPAQHDAARRAAMNQRKGMPQTYRELVVSVLAEAEGPLTAPQIAKILADSGRVRSYALAKTNVDTVVKRLNRSGHLSRLGDGGGWLLTATAAELRSDNGHP